MSSVDNYLLKLSCSAINDQLVMDLNAVIMRETAEEKNCFEKVSDHAGGTRAMECDIYLLAANYMPQGVIAYHLDALWKERSRGSHLVIPNAVQLFWQPDCDPDNRGMYLVYANQYPPPPVPERK